jgi:spermidine synthase
MHPDPKNALVVGLASGISLGSAGLHPLEELDCLEISPAMIEACRYFDDFNYRILDDPRVNVIINDARNYLALTAKQYDVIISQPSNPYIAGVADLFTREFFELSRQRLSPDGVMCTWVQAYNIGLETFRSIVRTFQEVFPNMTLWRTGKADCLLVHRP